jgi:tetratricopeptide (TPR) repeat protein
MTGEVSFLNDRVTLLCEDISTLRVGSKDYVIALDSLGVALGSQLDFLRQKDDMEEAILLLERALEFRKPPHPERPASLINLAHIIRMGFDKGVLDITQEKYANALDKAVALNREALELLSPDDDTSLRTYVMKSLAIALQSRSPGSGFLEESEDLNEVVSILTQVLELEFPDDPEHTTTLHKLGKILENLEFTGRGVDFSLPVSLHRQVVERRPPEHARRTHALVSLANILNARFQQDGQIGDLEEAISCSREALSLTPLSNNYHSTILLCLAKRCLFSHLPRIIRNVQMC